MQEANELLAKIDDLRKSLGDLLAEKKDLLDSEVISASQRLDTSLNEYNRILKKLKDN